MKSRSRQKAATKEKNTGPFPFDPVVEAYKRDIDRSLLRENLKLTVEQRLRNLQRLHEFASELRGAGRRIPDDQL